MEGVGGPDAETSSPVPPYPQAGDEGSGELDDSGRPSKGLEALIEVTGDGVRFRGLRGWSTGPGLESRPTGGSGKV